MDLDQHRQKRSRLRSADENGLSRKEAIAEDDTVQAGPSSLARVLTTTNALRDFSLQDGQPPAVQTPNPTPSTSFGKHPSLHQHGAPSSNFSFQHSSNNTFGPTPPPSFPVAGDTVNNAHPCSVTLTNPQASALPGSGLRAFDLPLHNSRKLQLSVDSTVTASAKQSSREARNPLSQADSSRHQSTVCPSDQLMHSLPQEAPGSRPLHKSSPQKGKVNSFQGISTTSEDRLFPRSPPAHPPNYYTSPFRVQNAATIANRKRKRGWPALPPPAYIYKRTNSPSFNVFGGILLYPELCFALAANLPVNDLVSLYAISKDFHTIIDTRFATVIRSQAIRKCPEGLRTFPARCYKYLCRPDPSPRIPHPHPTKQAAGEIRKVPSFRWLKMILFREKVCHEIMALMAEDGVPLPNRCELALKKLWFLMDIPDNARRIGYIHTVKLMTDLDLYFMMCFVVKLDMRFHDPMAIYRHHGLRKMLLTQRGLLPLWRALKRTGLSTRFEVLMMHIATKSTPILDEEGLPMFGVPGEEIGKMRMEYWGERSTHDTGKPCTVLLRPDQLFMREIVRRKMVFSKHFIRCLMWGYVNILTMKDYPPRTWNRRIKDLEDDYQDDDECGDYGELRGSVTDGLLDLIAKKPISMLVERDQGEVWKGEVRQREAVLQECMNWYLKERQKT